MESTRPMAVLVGAILALPAWSGQALTTSFDWSPWDRLLSAHVMPSRIDGVSLAAVDYRALAGERETFDGLLSALQGYDPSGLSRAEDKLAFWINVYNLAAVRLVLDHPGISSLDQVGPDKGAVWKMEAVRVGGRAFSLDAIEHQILRKLGEPRIHFAVVCASVSCPDLRSEAYRAAKLDAQLADQTRRFLAEPGKGLRFEPGRGEVWVTKLFEWFAEDFGGPAGLRAFIASNLPAGVEAPPGWASFQLRFLDYNWKLNARP